MLDNMLYIELIILGLCVLIHILGILKIYRDAKRLGRRFSSFWLAVVVFVPVAGPLAYLILKRQS